MILYELCCHDYPFPATTEPELRNKVLNQKMQKIPRDKGVNLEFTTFINQMLKKEKDERPCIEQIIYNDVFQTKAQLHQITLPFILNKVKVKQRYLTNKDLMLTPFQMKMIGLQSEQPAKSKSVAASKVEESKVKGKEATKKLMAFKDKRSIA